MDIEREVRAANRRIREQIDSSHREALARLGFDMDELRRAEQERIRQETIATWAGIGQAMASFQIELETFVRAVAAGYEERMRRG